MRVVYDHGILGGLFIMYLINKMLKIKGYSGKERFAFIGVFVLNGLSVSSINSIFGVFGLFLALTVYNDEKVEIK